MLHYNENNGRNQAENKTGEKRYSIMYPNSTGNMCSICKNCAFYDKSMKPCTGLKHYIMKIFSYRGITDIFRKKN